MSALYAGIAAIAAVTVLAVGMTVQTKRLVHEREAFAAYRAQVEVLGQAAAKRVKEAEAAATRAKELSDAENAASTANLNATVSRLRKQIAGGGGLSAAAPRAGGTALACYDGAQLAGALRGLDEEVLGIVAEGDKAVADLNTAKRWAGGR